MASLAAGKLIRPPPPYPPPPLLPIQTPLPPSFSSIPSFSLHRHSKPFADGFFTKFSTSSAPDATPTISAGDNLPDSTLSYFEPAGDLSEPKILYSCNGVRCVRWLVRSDRTN